MTGVSIRDQIVPAAPGALLAGLRELGVDSFEAAVDAELGLPALREGKGEIPSLRDERSIAQLADRLQAERMPITALLLATDFCGPDGDRHLDWAIRAAHAAQRLGVSAIRIDPLTARRELSADKVRQSFVARAARLLEQTAGTGVDIGIENHGPIANDEGFLDEIFAALPDSRLGLTLDTGNFYWWGYPISDVYRLIQKYAPRARHTHIKNINYPAEVAAQRRAIGREYKQCCCAIDEGNLDLEQIVRLLRAGGYDRALCIEDESLFKVPEPQRLAILGREVRSLRDALKAVAGTGPDRAWVRAGRERSSDRPASRHDTSAARP